MGRASRGKKHRRGAPAGEWTEAMASEAADRSRGVTLQRLPGNPWVHSFLRRSIDSALADVHRAVLADSGVTENRAWDLAASAVLGKLGLAPPWPHSSLRAADLQLDRTVGLLRSAGMSVVAPDAHAAVMAAAATVEPADTATLHRETDIAVPTGLLVLPRSLTVRNRNGSMSPVAAWGWTYTEHFSGDPATRFSGVQITTFTDRDAPVHTDAWRRFTHAARTDGHPLPPWFPDGFSGMRADGALAGADAEHLAGLSEKYRAVQDMLRRADPRCAGLPPHVGEWGDDEVEDPFEDLTQRYLFAYWRLVAQGTLSAVPLPSPAAHKICLAARTVPAGHRGYRHRWPVRMHKVRQWYPSLQRHQVIWRGPYIKGPAGAPLPAAGR